jgi:hypothetical protein
MGQIRDHLAVRSSCRVGDEPQWNAGGAEPFDRIKCPFNRPASNVYDATKVQQDASKLCQIA